MLSDLVKAKPKPWVIPRERPLELLFFRTIFSELQKREKTNKAAAHDPYQKVSVEGFQYSMERLFFLLGDSHEFDAKQYDQNMDGFVSWAEFFHVYRKRDVTVKLSLCERIYLTLDNPESSVSAQVVSNLILAIIIVSSVSFVLSTNPECHVDRASCSSYKTAELCCLLLFTVEYVLRVSTCWGVRSEVVDQARLSELAVGFEALQMESPLHKLVKFVVQPANLIDLAAILPGLISRIADTQGGAFVVLRLVRLTRILRAFKSPALSAAVKVISKTMQQSTQALYILSFNLMLGIVIFGSLMYMAEGGPELEAFGVGGRWNETTQEYYRRTGSTWNGEEWMTEWDRSPFQSIPHACWWAMVTVSTVGYGDMYPTTPLGKCVGIGTMLFSLIILALPVGVIGGTFSTVWDECDREKTLQEQELRANLEFMATEFARLDPSTLSRKMLIEVWVDPGCMMPAGSRPAPATFLGEAKVSLDLQPHVPSSRLCTVDLADNKDIVARTVTGKVTVKYDWMPETCAQNPGDVEAGAACGTGGDLQPIEPASAQHLDLKGTLKVTLVSAENLTILLHKDVKFRPYCHVIVFPTHIVDVEPQPYIWETPRTEDPCNPEWDVSHTFLFSWNNSKMDLDHGTGSDKQSPRAPQSPSRSDSVLGPGTPSGFARDDATAKVDEILALVQDMTAQLSCHKSDVKQVTEAVRDLSLQVDTVSRVLAPGGFAASYQDELSGGDGLLNRVPPTPNTLA